MRRLIFMTAMVLCSMAGMGQVTYFGNNYLLNYFTDIGYSAYDWRYEPQKTDAERGNLKGSVKKVVTNVADKTGRAYGEHFTDTTYYRPDGNIEKIVALKKDEFNPKNKFRPDIWTYEYDGSGRLKSYTLSSVVEMSDGKELRKVVHTAVRDAKGRIIQEVTRNYSQNKAGKWEEFGTGSNVTWTFTYDGSGRLSSGKGGSTSDMALTYQNGSLTKMQEDNHKPATFTHDAKDRLTGMKYFTTDELDDIDEKYEISTTLTYNERGDIVKAVKESWRCNDKWQRQKKAFTYNYTINYTYDANGNWTKALAQMKNGKSVSTITISRAISYR